MKCPYQDIGCWYIDDVSHDCEAENMGTKESTVCPHKSQNRPADIRSEKKQENEE